jgi:hypothetical protein
MLVVDDEIRVAIQERAPAAHLKKLMSDKVESTIFEKGSSRSRSRSEACKFRDHIGNRLR